LVGATNKKRVYSASVRDPRTHGTRKRGYIFIARLGADVLL
jgi:hypothetical protein